MEFGEVGLSSKFDEDNVTSILDEVCVNTHCVDIYFDIASSMKFDEVADNSEFKSTSVRPRRGWPNSRFAEGGLNDELYTSGLNFKFDPDDDGGAP